MKRIWARNSCGLGIRPEDRFFDSEAMLVYTLSVEVHYYGHYPNKWYDSYKAQLYELFKNEKGNWYVHSKWGYYCFRPSDIDSDAEMKYFFDKLEVSIRTLIELLLNLPGDKDDEDND